MPNTSFKNHTYDCFTLEETFFVKHTYMALGVELGMNGAEVHCQIMINVEDAVLNFLNTEFLSIRAFFHATKVQTPKTNESSLACRNFIKIMIDNKCFRLLEES